MGLKVGRPESGGLNGHWAEDFDSGPLDWDRGMMVEKVVEEV
jgi:hypothetical protein